MVIDSCEHEVMLDVMKSICDVLSVTMEEFFYL